jgi:hypothetical protein
MNRRLPRITLLVIWLVSMLVVSQGGGISPGLVRAEGESCGLYQSGEEITETDIPPVGTPDETGSFQVDSVYEAPKDDDLPFGQTLIQLTLFPEGEVSVLSNGNSIIRVDSNEVTLWNCGETDIDILSPGSNEPVPVKPGEHGAIQAGQAIIVDGQDVFYLSQGNADALSTPSGAVQQLSNDLSTDAMSTLQDGGSKLSVAVAKPAKVCSGGGC